MGVCGAHIAAEQLPLRPYCGSTSSLDVEEMVVAETYIDFRIRTQQALDELALIHATEVGAERPRADRINYRVPLQVAKARSLQASDGEFCVQMAVESPRPQNQDLACHEIQGDGGLQAYCNVPETPTEMEWMA
ncbi:uncharacterized protein N7459_006838 [Penicillium hispanicum]|uniref:uncharacterized protein n=1 Tax=Penicillium hispanicum TaxID=1080232 RepID=UPI0025411A89|nr:uncharacterized protein N7459_006838 [Penicillium hispanicum]KAJ5577874.1 hypothetical protein N7459_006838 [Penicillium hispanicum]